MKKYLSIIILTFVGITSFAQADNIIGTWLTEDKEAHVKIYKINNIYYGKISWLKKPNDPDTGKPWLDKENETVSKRKRPLMGSKMLWGFKYDDGEYDDGSVYDSRDGETYSGKLWLEDKNTLEMRGYWGFFYSTETWTRVK
ncbi:MAG: hypothetical protein ACI8ZM_001641 [Crocinitomix sp.]|jgi:uncharacterized protein (DUF2147 family)